MRSAMLFANSPAVHLSITGTVSKRVHISSHFYDIPVGVSFQFFEPLQNSKVTPSAGALYTQGGKNL